ncbi:NAD-dependent epimerase/dehydratase family protein [Sorangium sp. So ce281]|uniref:NAD-dependent epimerase/dehydratase family protein n=1 Tax=unclassified Sorangium TaxID=2621164 RepID=UPI003F5F7025
MKVFVTGGSGFIGGHLIEGLVRAGHEVSALARSPRSADVVRRHGAAPVAADLGTLKGEDLAGAEAAVHCAAYVEEWGTRAQFWEGNVEGTARALDAARAAGVRRFVHVGTEAALFDGHDLVDIDEAHPYPGRQRFLYSETKAEAERRVLAANEPGGMTTVSIRPRLVWGPRDATVLPVVLRMAREGSFAWLDGGGARTSTTPAGGDRQRARGRAGQAADTRPPQERGRPLGRARPAGASLAVPRRVRVSYDDELMPRSPAR